MIDEDKAMKNLIISWSLPECLEEIKDDVIFIFDDNNLFDIKEKGYHCRKNSVKFCLYNTKLKKVLFSMDFFWREENRAFPDNLLPKVELMLIRTHVDEFKRKGIASYYISKLREYAIVRNAKCIYVTAHADVGRLSLSQKKLVEFYKKRSTENMPIELNTLTS